MKYSNHKRPHERRRFNLEPELSDRFEGIVLCVCIDKQEKKPIQGNRNV